MNVVLNNSYNSQFAVDFGSKEPLQLLTTGCENNYNVCKGAVPYNTSTVITCSKYNKGNSTGSDSRIGYRCEKIGDNDILDIVKMCVAGHDLTPLPQGEVVFLTEVTGANVPAHTGFSYGAPFLKYLVTQFGSNTSENDPSFVLDVAEARLLFKSLPVFDHFVHWDLNANHAGRSITVSHIHYGSTGSVAIEGPFLFMIDTGNDSFLTYDQTDHRLTSDVFDSEVLKFTIQVNPLTGLPGILEGNHKSITITFNNRHRFNKQSKLENSSSLNTASPYTHNVFALGFLSNFLVGIYDSNSDPSYPHGRVFLGVQSAVDADVTITKNFSPEMPVGPVGPGPIINPG